MITTHLNGNVLSVLLTARAINPLSRLFQRELAGLLALLEARREQLSAVIFGFSSDAGATAHELEHLMTLTPAQAADCMQMLGAYNALLRKLETLGVPVLAMLSGDISGHALGLALACHQRVAHRDTYLSLPQIQLGLAPVAGAIVRSVRLLGLQAAQPLLLDGAQLSATQALQCGLLHAIAANEQELTQLATRVQDKQTSRQPWDTSNYQPPGVTDAVAMWRQSAPAFLRQRHGDDALACEAILCVMVEGLQVDFDTALLIESRYFCQTALRSSFSTNLKRFV